MDSQLFTIASQGHPVLTVNNRLARYLLQQFSLEMQQSGSKVWKKPLIMPLGLWLQQQVKHLQPSGGGYLSTAQELLLWETIIEQDLDADQYPLFQVGATARKARDAHRLLIQYQIGFDPSQAAHDHQVFHRWQQQWLARLTADGFQDSAQIPWTVAEALGSGCLETVKHLVLAGFDTLTPDVLQLQSVLEGQGASVTFWQPRGFDTAQCRVVASQDPRDELSRCVRWVRQLLLSGESRIGVIAPNLEHYRSEINEMFSAELDPTGFSRGSECSDLVTLSLGGALADEGPVAAALLLLGLSQPLGNHDVYTLLRNPYLGGSLDEASARALADVHLRESGAVAWTPGQLLKQLGSLSGVSRFVEQLRILARFIEDRSTRTPGEWAETFAQALDDCGWPGQRKIDSREYQAVHHFKGLLSELATLDRVCVRIGRGRAFGLLSRLAKESVFQVATQDGPVQVLGLLEAAGMTFDHLWVLGLHDAALPGAPKPNPFLPLPLQRQHGLPHADAERERQFAHDVSMRLLRAAPTVVASYPQQVDGSPRQPSSCIDHLVPIDLPLPETVEPLWTANKVHPKLEVFIDNTVQPLVSRKPFSGGTGLLKDQALCPFRAFAHHRLKAKGLETPDVGLDSLARGSLAHAVLEFFWKETGDQVGLLALTDNELDDRLLRFAEQALSQLERYRRRDLPPQLRMIEKQRQVRLARKWLEFEKTRPAFVVAAVEQQHQEVIGRLTIRTKVDRIDSFADGGMLIIDYKTGQTDPSRWFGDRVTEPQLPIYCLGQAASELAAVAFAAVGDEHCGFRGLSRNPDMLPGMTKRMQDNLAARTAIESFDEALAHWRTAIPRLGDAFANGNAAVDPVDLQQACKYCDLEPFCRIHERTAVRG